MTADGPVVHTVHASCIAVSCVSRCKDISSDKKKLIKKTDGSLYKVLEQSAAVTAGGPVVKPCAQYWSFGMTADGPVVHTVHASCIAVSCVSRCKDISSDKKKQMAASTKYLSTALLERLVVQWYNPGLLLRRRGFKPRVRHSQILGP